MATMVRTPVLTHDIGHHSDCMRYPVSLPTAITGGRTFPTFGCPQEGGWCHLIAIVSHCRVTMFTQSWQIQHRAYRRPVLFQNMKWKTGGAPSQKVLSTTCGHLKWALCAILATPIDCWRWNEIHMLGQLNLSLMLTLGWAACIALVRSPRTVMCLIQLPKHGHLLRYPGAPKTLPRNCQVGCKTSTFWSGSQRSDRAHYSVYGDKRRLCLNYWTSFSAYIQKPIRRQLHSGALIQC